MFRRYDDMVRLSVHSVGQNEMMSFGRDSYMAASNVVVKITVRYFWKDLQYILEDEVVLDGAPVPHGKWRIRGLEHSVRICALHIPAKPLQIVERLL